MPTCTGIITEGLKGWGWEGVRYTAEILGGVTDFRKASDIT